jgi:hypothetical protein
MSTPSLWRIGARRHTHTFAMDVPACRAGWKSAETKESGHRDRPGPGRITLGHSAPVRNFVRAAQVLAQRRPAGFLFR